MKRKNKPVRLLIIGSGKGGTSLIQLLHDDPSVRIVGIVDKNPRASGLELAKRFKIPTSQNYRSFLKQIKPDLLIDVTGNAVVRKDLMKLNLPIEIMGGHSAKFLWQLIDTRIKRRQELERLLFEYQALYDLGLTLTASENLDYLYRTVVEYASHLTNTPASSLAIFDEKQGEMILGAAKGFGQGILSQPRWRIRKGGLTSTILNQTGPFIITDVSRFPKANSPILAQEKIKSLMATPLRAEGKIIGILYVDDFKPRQFTAKEISLISLLATITAMAMEKARLFETTRLLAITDELTGLYNHRHFRLQLNNEVSRALRYGRQACLMMIDIDYFKKYNDTHGHIKGNEVLRELGCILKEISRDVDIVSRYGGEEFCIILPETDRQKAWLLAERLREKIEAYPFKNRRTQPDHKLTVSIGLASIPKDAVSAFELLEKADRALYTAKHKGRNKVFMPDHNHHKHPVEINLNKTEP